MLTRFVPRGCALAIALLVAVFCGSAQTTVSTGSIQGTVTDPSGAAVAGAKVTITGKATGSVATTTTSASGAYSSGGLIPGDYEVKVEQPGFSTAVLTATVQVGVTANGNIKLAIGQASQVVEVTTTAVAVNPDQAMVQGVLTAAQIDTLPINGRNFLDLAQLEPGVQIQDGTNFDPTKVGYSSISFGGRFGRTARFRWMAWTSPMRRSEPSRKTSRRAVFRSSNSANRTLTSRTTSRPLERSTWSPVPAATSFMASCSTYSRQPMGRDNSCIPQGIPISHISGTRWAGALAVI